MKLFVNNEVDNAIVSSPDEDINYPASNVQDKRLSRFFRGDKSIDFNITGAGSPKTIAQAYTNLVTDPVDLTTGNWTTALLLSTTLSSQTIYGLQFTELTVDGLSINDSANQAVTLSGTEAATSYIIRNVDAVSTLVDLIEGGQDRGRALITWATKTVTLNSGLKVDYTWIDDITLQIDIIADNIAGANGTIHIFPTRTLIACSVLVTAVQCVKDTTTMFPFVDGTHSADVIDETFTMPDRFIIDSISNSRYAFNSAIGHMEFAWRITADKEFRLQYIPSIDKYHLVWDEGNERVMVSIQFDDGSNFININQKLRFIIFANLITGNINGSSFFILEEDGTIHVVNAWSGTPDIKELAYTTLSIANLSGGSQGDLVMEYLRVYEWNGTKPTITSNQDITDYLADKKILLDKTYMSRLTATDLLIAKSTINDGDVITLRANDWDSFNSGTPVDETVTWSKDIITHTFTKASYQYWRLSVNSSNVIDIGRIFLGLSYSTPYLGVDISHSYQSGTVKTRTPIGVTYGDIRIKENLISVKWPKILTATDKPALITAFDFVDISKPFFWTFDDSVSLLGTLYGTIDGNGLHFVYYRNPVYSRAAISFIEEKG